MDRVSNPTFSVLVLQLLGAFNFRVFGSCFFLVDFFLFNEGCGTFQPALCVFVRKIPGDVGEGLRFLHPSWCGNLGVGTESGEEGEWRAVGKGYIYLCIYIYTFIIPQLSIFVKSVIIIYII